MRIAIVLALAALASGCGGNSDPPAASAAAPADPAPAQTPAATDPPSIPAPATPAFNPFEGVWLTQSGAVLAPYLIIDANGDYWFSITVGQCTYLEEAGVFSASGATMTGPYGAQPWNDTLLCPSTASQLAVTASLAAGTLTLNTTWILTSASPPLPPAPEAALTTWTLSPLSSLTPSLASIAGNWTLPDGSVMTIAQDGTLTLDNHDLEGITSCQIAGTVSIADPATNVYTVSANALDGCLGIYPDGWAVTGVFTFDGTKLHGGLTIGPDALISLDTN